MDKNEKDAEGGKKWADAHGDSHKEQEPMRTLP